MSSSNPNPCSWMMKPVLCYLLRLTAHILFSHPIYHFVKADLTDTRVCLINIRGFNSQQEDSIITEYLFML